MKRAFRPSMIWLAAAACAAIAGGLPPAASAQPSYAQGDDSSETIQGTIYQITGRYTLTLEDDRGFIDNITLHGGTVITPTGLALGSGEIATLTGHTSGKTFEADEIDVDPTSVSSGQAVLPGGDYNTTYSYGSNSDYPAYAFGYDPSYSAGSLYFGASNYGGYGYYAPTGYYPGYGSGYGRGGVTSPYGGANGTGAGTSDPKIPRRPVRTPVGLPPGTYYPTGGNRIAPPSYGTVPVLRGAPAAPRSAPAAPRSAPASSGATSRSR